MLEPNPDVLIKEYFDELDKVFSYLDATEEEVKNSKVDMWYGTFLSEYTAIGFSKAVMHEKDADKYYPHIIDYIDKRYEDPYLYHIDDNKYKYIRDNIDGGIEKGHLYVWDNEDSFIVCDSYWDFFKNYVNMSELRIILQDSNNVFNAIKFKQLRDEFGEIVAYVPKAK